MKDIEILEHQTAYQGYAKVETYLLKHKLFAGGMSQPIARELLVRFDAVAILPYDPKLDRVVLIEQFRIGALREGINPWLQEIVAGVIDKDHSKEEIATLECQEEAGLTVQKLIPITEYWSSPGASSERVTLYCAIVDASNANGIHGVAAENEDILVHTMASQEAFAGVRSGQINNAATIIALQWLELQLQQEKEAPLHFKTNSLILRG